MSAPMLKPAEVASLRERLAFVEALLAEAEIVRRRRFAWAGLRDPDLHTRHEIRNALRCVKTRQPK